MRNAYGIAKVGTTCSASPKVGTTCSASPKVGTTCSASPKVGMTGTGSKASSDRHINVAARM